uniref:Uncharacterized protein n=1 Tax=Cacopsylla melanoneura TaxID=428564 RepID=A0A8D8ZAZ4_9HEMI
MAYHEEPKLNTPSSIGRRVVDGGGGGTRMQKTIEDVRHIFEANKMNAMKCVSIAIIGLIVVYTFYNSQKYVALDWSFAVSVIVLESYLTYLLFATHAADISKKQENPFH